MPNNYFQFKQFTIQQGNCAMKVCTDACLFGALLANALQQHSAATILDIGCGTGLLALMLAQKTNAIIDGAEIDETAFEQAKENISASPWKEKITVHLTDIIKFDAGKKYDCIISNPPFFENDLQSSDDKKNAAKHDSTLTYMQLLQVINKNLTGDGFFAVLLPFSRSNYFKQEAGKLHFFLTKEIVVKQTTKHNYFRSVLFFCRDEAKATQQEITIKNDAGNYTDDFINLLKDYYLYL